MQEQSIGNLGKQGNSSPESSTEKGKKRLGNREAVHDSSGNCIFAYMSEYCRSVGSIPG